MVHLASDVSATPEVFAPTEREAARNTSRRDALASRTWFTSGRWTHQSISIAHSTTKGK